MPKRLIFRLGLVTLVVTGVWQTIAADFARTVYWARKADWLLIRAQGGLFLTLKLTLSARN